MMNSKPFTLSSTLTFNRRLLNSIVTASKPKSGPPYDNKPCVACPAEVRNLFAVASNLTNLLKIDTGYPRSRVIEKVYDLQDVVLDFRKLHITKISSVEIINLYESCRYLLDNCNSIDQLIMYRSTLRDAVNQFEPLINQHYSNVAHSHPPNL